MKPVAYILSVVAIMAANAASSDTVTIKVGYSPGGSYDGVARLVAEHIGRQIEGNPDVIVENVPGAGSLKLARGMMSAKASDGIVIATVSSALALRPIFKPDDTAFDPTKVYYAASMSNSASYCISPKSTGITSLQQLLDDDQAKVGSTGKSSTTYTYPSGIKSALGGKFEIVTGFKGGSQINLAMERGDLTARCGTSYAALLSGDTLERYNVIAELSPIRHNAFEGVDFALDFASDDKTRAALALIFASGTVHHPYILSPSTDVETVQMVRDAFDAMIEDEEFLADAEARGVPVVYTGGAAVEERIAGILTVDGETADLARQFVE